MAGGQVYKLPDGFDQTDVVDLTPETQHSAELKPTSMVICINRGPKTIKDMFDAETYEVPPFAKFRCQYQVARHLQTRNIVPGTRNPNPTDSSAPQYVPWIAIIGLDPDARAFTDAELEQFGESVEGINRHLVPTRAGREVELAQTDVLRRGLPGLGVTASAAVGAGGKPDQQVFGDDEAIARALEPVGEGQSLASQDAAAAANAGHRTPTNVEQTSAPPPREERPRGGAKGNRTR